VLRVEVALVLASVVATCLLFGAWGGMRMGPRPWSLVLATAAGTSIIAAIAGWLALAPGRSMSGRPRGWLIAAALLVPVACFGWKLGWSAAFDGMSIDWPARSGWRCFRFSLLLAAFPLGTLFYLRRGSDPFHPRASGAAVGAAVGSFATVLVDLWCPVGYAYHLLLGHLLPLAIITATATWLGGRVLSQSYCRRST
jgi:hypothetical protein